MAKNKIVFLELENQEHARLKELKNNLKLTWTKLILFLHDEFENKIVEEQNK